MDVDFFQPHTELAAQCGHVYPGDAADGSKYMKYFALTKDGHPVGVAEYAADIAAGQRIHVVQFYDWDPNKHWRVEVPHIANDARFYDFVLKSRPGYARTSLVP